MDIHLKSNPRKIYIYIYNLKQKDQKKRMAKKDIENQISMLEASQHS
jgi:hypothetical protein